MKRGTNVLWKYAVGVIFSAISAQAFAADFFVRPGGTGNGSSWSTAAGSPSSAPSGSTVYVAGGSYRSWSLNGKTNLTVRRATASSHGSDTGWQASYDSQVQVGGDGAVGCIQIQSGANAVTVDGVVKNGIWARGCLHGIRASANNITLRYLELGDAGSMKNGEDGIQGDGDNLLVEHCNIHDNDDRETHGDGVQWFAGNNVTFRYNIFKNNGQQMMLTETVWGNDYINNLQIYYNVFYNRGGAHYNGISKKLCPQAGQYWYIYNNTFDLEASSGGYENEIFSGAGSCKQMIFKNNAIAYSKAGSVGNLTHSYNGYDNSGSDMAQNAPADSTSVRAADLGFIDASTANYRLKATSPLIGKGTNVGLTRDFDGNPVGANPSIGAFELAGSTPPPPPPANVAPSVSISSPVSGSSFVAGATVTVNANASDSDGSIAKVELFRNSVKIGEDLTSPYSIAMSNMAQGSYTLMARATDNAGATKDSAAVSITVTASTTPPPPPPANVAPTVSITSPSNGASFSAGMSIAINASASDSDGSIAKVEFFDGATKLGEDLTAPYSLTMSNSVAGTHSLSARATDNAGAIANSAAVSVTVNPVTQPPPPPPPSGTSVTLLSSQVPALMNMNDGVSYELGMRFTSTAAGKIMAIRFWKTSSESGTHTGKIYSSSGALLASVVFSSETASGWQQMNLASPLSIAANTEYTVSVNTGAGYYVATNNGMASQISNGSLRSVVGNNGVYGSVGSRPTQSWQNSNYFRDIVFVADSSSSPAPSSGDASAPVASITSPVSGASVTAGVSLNIQAQASDDKGVVKVEFYVNGNLRCTDTTVPYVCPWSPRRAGRTYQLQVKAHDASGKVGSSAIVSVNSK
ncbi:MAG: Ig-like domain-containing protein [Pseudobdellovibrionaceae bacterium]